jgi:two-component system, OmpR family, sensor histidine kinase KdpD
MRSLIQSRKIRQKFTENLPPVAVDPIFIGQVLVNLIENAIRYTPPESPIEITVRVNTVEMFIIVDDHGPGFPPSELGHVFESFYRLNQRINGCNAASSNEGSGLGLAVCKGFVEAHGGRIWAENRDGGGARLQFTLPLHSAERVVHEKDSRC